MSEKKPKSLIVQAGILAAAGILVRIIGLLYNTPLVKIIGDEGNGYYNSAYAAYSIVLLISSYSIPSAVAKVMSAKIARREYRSAYRVFKAALIYVVIVGIIAASFLYFGAGILVKMESAILPLRILAPTVFLSGILGVFRGFFQAQKTMVPTSFSQIIEQIFNAVASVVTAYLLVKSVSESAPQLAASYGAAGSTVGTGVGVLSALIFMIAMYLFNRKGIKKRIAEDPHLVVDSYKSTFITLLMIVTPFILSTCIYNVNTFMDNRIYQDIMMVKKGFAESRVAFNLSAISKAIKIANIPIALSSAMASTLIPNLSADMATGNMASARVSIGKAIRMTMYISIPCAVGMSVLSKPIMMLLFPQKASLDLASTMLILLSFTVILYGLSTITQAVIQSAGKMNLPIVNALIAVIVHAVFMVVLTIVLPEGASLYIYAISTIIYALIMCILNGICMKRCTGYTQELDRTFLRPIICAIVMGLCAFGTYHGAYILLHSNFISLLFAIVIAIFVYFFLTLKWKAVSEEDLCELPRGRAFAAIARKMRLL